MKVNSFAILGSGKLLAFMVGAMLVGLVAASCAPYPDVKVGPPGPAGPPGPEGRQGPPGSPGATRA